MRGVKKYGFTPLNAKASRLQAGNLTGFTLIELLVVVGIIGVLATLVTIAFRTVSGSGRDARRISDVAQIQRALEIYKNDNGIYPAGGAFVVGQPLVSLDGNITYFSKLPANPLPDDGSSCSAAEYTYTQVNSGASYSLEFCLGKTTGGVGPENVTAIPSDFITTGAAPAAVCGNNTLEGAEVCDHTGVTPECGLMAGYYPLNAGVPACDGRQACKSDCTECPVGECNGAQ
ncbi:MAG: prepilin-type N-terminal cleavage/methylation domain-containing protein [Patescibacteria group bacterium]|jgi:general secretion pathway protein G